MIKLIKHQLLHLLFHHPFKACAFQHSTLFDLAADLAVNQYLNFANIVPDPKQYEQLYQLIGKTQSQEELAPLEFFYGALLNLQEHPLIMDILESHQALHRQHAHWAKLYQYSTAQQRILYQKTQLAIQATLPYLVSSENTAHQKLSTHIVQQQSADEQSDINWRRLLRRFAGQSRYTRMEHSLRRPSRRYGTFPGIQRRRKTKLWVALDVSGSISATALKVFWKELGHIDKLDVAIEVIAFDHRIQTVFEYQSTKLPQFSGGGGTDFQQPILFINQQRRADAILFFTDGQGVIPKVLPKIPLLWLIVPDGIGRSNNRWHSFPGHYCRDAQQGFINSTARKFI